MSARPYRPSNGFEGELFMMTWCGRCERDRAFREAGSAADPALACSILTDHPDYPRFFVQDDQGSRCTAFVPTGGEALPPRCDRTPDLFGGT